MLPFEFHDFPQPRAGQDQQADGRSRERIDHGAPIGFLGRVLCGRLRLIDDPRKGDIALDKPKAMSYF
jgi:hypothetical protein